MEDEPILTHIFQMGWFNHHLFIHVQGKLIISSIPDHDSLFLNWKGACAPV